MATILKFEISFILTASPASFNFCLIGQPNDEKKKMVWKFTLYLKTSPIQKKKKKKKKKTLELPTIAAYRQPVGSAKINARRKSCLFCLLDVHWLLSCLLRLFSWNGASYSAYCLFIGYWVAYSANSAGTAGEPPIPPTTCSLAGIELGTPSSSGKSTNHLANHDLHGLLRRIFQKIRPSKYWCPGSLASGLARLTFWLIFFQSYMFRLFFSGLL